MDLKLVKTKDINELKRELKDIRKENLELQDEWLSTAEAAKFLKVSKKTLLRYRNMGKLPYSKDGRKVRYKKSDIIKYLKNHYFSLENL
ncbi:MAG: DNA-binding protein [Marinilabiliales bacterium]|nr:MAG: DNA-binding protein [Marinilabiliales bacterium]